MNDPRFTCPHCSEKMRAYKTAKIGGFVRRYRHCRSCGLRDVALYKPEEIVVSRTIVPPVDTCAGRAYTEAVE